MPFVTVIVPTYGRPQFLREALDSVLAQTVEDLECLVVDDGSPTPVELPRDPRIRLLRRASNGGVAAARNVGIEAATGRYVTFLDDDDILAPNRIEVGLRATTRAPVGLCLLAPLHSPRAGPRHDLEGDVRDTIADTLVPNVGQALVHREVLQRFDERLRASEDIDWWIRMSAQCEVSTEPEVGYLFRHHGGVRHGNDVIVRIEMRRRVLEKHQAYFEAHPRAHAFQLRRIAAAEARAGDRWAARRTLVTSLRLHPSPRTGRDLADTFRRADRGASP